MKTKKILNIIFIGIISLILLPFSVSAKSISTLDATSNNYKLTVSGTTENGVLAIAVLVYSNSNLSHMETCSVDSNVYNCELSKTFEIGSYTIKVADYDGGNYITKDIIVSAPPEPTGGNDLTPQTPTGTNPESTGGNDLTPQTPTESNPKTFDGIILYIGLGLLSIVGLTGACLNIKKNIKLID